MRVITLRKKTDQAIVCEKARIAESLFERLLGLMFKKTLEKSAGLVIIPCYQIHTFFMFMAIDVLFIDKDMKILKVYRNFKPWRLSRFVWKSHFVLEMMAGNLPDYINEGDVLEELCLSS